MNKTNHPALVLALAPKSLDRPNDGSLPMPPSDTANLDSIPLNVLSLPDEHEQMQSPEVGDVVNYTVTGKVVSVDGGTAKVQRTSINGQDVPGTDADDHGDAGQPEIPDTEAAELRQQAGGMGSLMGLIIALFLLCGSLAQADGQTSLVVGNASYTNLLFVGGVATKLRCVQGYESGTTQFIQVFSTNGTGPPMRTGICTPAPLWPG